MNRERVVTFSVIGIVAVLVLGVQLWTWSDYKQRYELVANELEEVQTNLAALSQTEDVPSAITADAEPFTIAFVSDTETLSRWDEILEFIAAEGADLLLHQGDFVDGLNPETFEPATFEGLISEPILDADGNPTGAFNCDGPMQGVRCILGPDFLMLGAATGKQFPEILEDYFFENLTAIEEAGGEWGGCVRDGDMGSPGVRMRGCHDGDNLADARAADYWVRWKDVSLVFQNAQPDTSWVPQILQGDDNIWKVCLWHGNHFDFQTGEKGSGYDGKDHSLPYEMYRNCADYGAIVINGNEHVYSRTCVLGDIGNEENGGPGFANRVNREPGTSLENHGAVCPHAGVSNAEAVDVVEELEIGPGRSMVIVSAVPGYAWREYIPDVTSEITQDTFRHKNDGWWATMFTTNRYCRNNCTTADLSAQNSDAFVPGMNPPQKTEEPADAPWDPYSDGHGVLFITFNYNGDPYKAHGYFKIMRPDPETGRQIIDEFIITYVP